MALEIPIGLKASTIALASAISEERWPEAYMALMSFHVSAAAAVPETEGGSRRLAAELSGPVLMLLGGEIAGRPGLDASARLAVLAYLAGTVGAGLSPEALQLAKMVAGRSEGNVAKAKKRARWQDSLNEWLQTADMSRTNAALAHAFRQERPRVGAPAGDGIDKAIRAHRKEAARSSSR